jgi:hypothetical protein
VEGVRRAAYEEEIVEPEELEPAGEEPRSADPNGNRRAGRNGPPARPARRTVAADVAAEIEEIDLAISQMIVEEPTVWLFDELRERAEAALAGARTAVERGKARLLLGKISRLEEIRQRYEKIVDTQAETDRRNRQLEERKIVPAEPARRDEAVHEVDHEEPRRFDGLGRLAVVSPQRPDLPQFALIDQQGNVLTFVNAAPGVNLRPHLGRDVGLDGVRGYSEQLQAPLLTAKKLTLLDELR